MRRRDFLALIPTIAAGVAGCLAIGPAAQVTRRAARRQVARVVRHPRTYIWTGAMQTSTWGDARNWLPSGLPSSGDVIHFIPPSEHPPRLPTSGHFDTVHVGRGAKLYGSPLCEDVAIDHMIVEDGAIVDLREGGISK